jgi:hypothetical protein
MSKGFWKTMYLVWAKLFGVGTYLLLWGSGGAVARRGKTEKSILKLTACIQYLQRSCKYRQENLEKHSATSTSKALKAQEKHLHIMLQIKETVAVLQGELAARQFAASPVDKGISRSSSNTGSQSVTLSSHYTSPLHWGAFLVIGEKLFCRMRNGNNLNIKAHPLSKNWMYPHWK